MRPLSSSEQTALQPFFPYYVVTQARIVEGRVPFWLHANMAAVVLGHTIYVRQPLSALGQKTALAFLAHELTHVQQFLNGMTVWQYVWESRHGYHQNRFEVEAYAMEARVNAHIGVD